MELIAVILIFLSIMTVGAVSTFNEMKSNVQPVKWAFKPESASKVSFDPINATNQYVAQLETTVAAEGTELSDYTEVLLETQSNYLNQEPIDIDRFEESFEGSGDIEDFTTTQLNDEILTSVSALVQAVNEELNAGNESKASNETLEEVKELVGPNVAALVTNDLYELTENEESVVIGLYSSERHELSFGEYVIPLTTDVDIIAGKDDYVLVKGMLLPSKEFRVLHHEDADTVEQGYGKEQFILRKTA